MEALGWARARSISLGMGHDLFAVAGIWCQPWHRPRYLSRPPTVADSTTAAEGRCSLLSEVSSASASLSTMPKFTATATSLRGSVMRLTNADVSFSLRGHAGRRMPGMDRSANSADPVGARLPDDVADWGPNCDEFIYRGL